MQTIIATGKTVILKPSDPPLISAGGVILPSRRKPGHREHKGTVVSIGPDITATAGGKLLAVGDLLATSAHAGREFTVDNVVYATVDECDILGRIDS